MREFGIYLQQMCQKKTMSFRTLSARLGQRGIKIDSTVLSRWHTGERSPTDANREGLIQIGDILNMTTVEKDTLLMKAGLAPTTTQEEEIKRRKPEVAETLVELALEYDDYDQYLKEWQITVTWYETFIIDTLSSQILIDTIQVRTSDPSVPYHIMLFEDQPLDSPTLWDKEDLIQMEPVTQRVFTWGKGFPFSYMNREGLTLIYGGIGMQKKPIRFDLDAEDFMAYVRQPVQYEIRLQYLLRQQ